jgi:flagellar biosynthesis GTPase FlhF
VLTIDENGGTMAQRSLWLAMEDLAFKNAKKYPGKSFVISQDKLGEKAKMHFSSVKRISKHFEGLGLLSIKKRRKKGSCRYDVHFYTLHYPKQPIDHSDLRSHRSCNNLDIQLCEASKCPAADAASPLALRHFDASHQKDIDEALAAKREASAKYKAEQLAAAEERKRQEEAELAQRKERLKLSAEKEKADKEAAERAEDARRLAMRSDVGSCVAAIHTAAFDEYDPGTLPGVLADFDRATFYEAVGKLLPDMSDKLRSCIKRNEWMFE